MQTYSHGKFSIYTSVAYYRSIEKWILDRQFLQYEKQALLLGRKSRKRNKLYCFYSESANTHLVMKVSEISRHYRFWRKVNLYITSLFKDYNYNGYKGSIKLLEAGVDTVHPIAYWTHGTSWSNRKSYFLYEKVESDVSVAELCDEIVSRNLANKGELIDVIVSRCVDVVRKIHAAHIRHDDPHGGNILTSLTFSDMRNIAVEDVKNATFTLIDNDRCTFNHSTSSTLKRFYDLKCLRRFNICRVSQRVLLQQYLGDEYRRYWGYVLSFWKLGGFSVNRHISNILK